MARRSHVRRDPAGVFVFELRNEDFYHLELTKPGLAKTTSRLLPLHSEPGGFATSNKVWDFFEFFS